MITYRACKFQDGGFLKVRVSICEAQVQSGVVSNVGYSIDLECAVDTDYDPKVSFNWSSIHVNASLLGARDHKLFSFVSQVLRDCDNKGLKSPSEILDLLQEKGAKQLFQVVSKNANGFPDYQWALVPFAKIYRAFTPEGKLYALRAAPTEAQFKRHLKFLNTNWATFKTEKVETFSNGLVSEMELIEQLKNY